MADLADLAQDLTETRLEQSLRNRTTLSIPFSGVCLSCQEPVQGKRRFCDAGCREDWEQERRRKFANLNTR